VACLGARHPAIAQAGLIFAKDAYDRERYAHLYRREGPVHHRHSLKGADNGGKARQSAETYDDEVKLLMPSWQHGSMSKHRKID
jgi:Hydrolase of X-linked nucleoside diphosphate N terminal